MSTVLYSIRPGSGEACRTSWVTSAGDPEFADYLMDMAADWWSAWYETMLKEVGEYVDIMWLGDDWGTQNGPLVQPEQFEKRVQPRIRRVIDSMHKYCDAKVAYHSCGSISWAFDSLRDAGVDIIQPVQANAAGMQDSRKIKRNDLRKAGTARRS